MTIVLYILIKNAYSSDDGKSMVYLTCSFGQQLFLGSLHPRS
jgi:hypothetical protein